MLYKLESRICLRQMQDKWFAMWGDTFGAEAGILTNFRDSPPVCAAGR